MVPGHGPVCGVDGVRSIREYLEYVRRESHDHWSAGRTPLEASVRIELGPYAAWNEPFRLAANVHRCSREFDGARWDSAYDSAAVMADMRSLKAMTR